MFKIFALFFLAAVAIASDNVISEEATTAALAPELAVVGDSSAAAYDALATPETPASHKLTAPAADEEDDEVSAGKKASDPDATENEASKTDDKTDDDKTESSTAESSTISLTDAVEPEKPEKDEKKNVMEPKKNTTGAAKGDKKTPPKVSPIPPIDSAAGNGTFVDDAATIFPTNSTDSGNKTNVPEPSAKQDEDNASSSLALSIAALFVLGAAF